MLDFLELFGTFLVTASSCLFVCIFRKFHIILLSFLLLNVIPGQQFSRVIQMKLYLRTSGRSSRCKSSRSELVFPPSKNPVLPCLFPHAFTGRNLSSHNYAKQSNNLYLSNAISNSTELSVDSYQSN